MEFFTTTACWTSIAVAGVLSLTRAGAWNVAPVLMPRTNQIAFAFQYAACTCVPFMSRERYFWSTVAESIVPWFAFTSCHVAPPPGVFVEYTARMTFAAPRLELKKCAPVTARLPSAVIEGHTKSFDGQNVPHINPSWEKKPPDGL